MAFDVVICGRPRGSVREGGVDDLQEPPARAQTWPAEPAIQSGAAPRSCHRGLGELGYMEAMYGNVSSAVREAMAMATPRIGGGSCARPTTRGSFCNRSVLGVGAGSSRYSLRRLPGFWRRSSDEDSVACREVLTRRPGWVRLGGLATRRSQCMFRTFPPMAFWRSPASGELTIQFLPTKNGYPTSKSVRPVMVLPISFSGFWPWVYKTRTEFSEQIPLSTPECGTCRFQTGC